MVKNDLENYEAIRQLLNSVAQECAKFNPNDNRLNTGSVAHLLYKLEDGASLESLLRSNIQVYSVVLVLGSLYYHGLLDFDEKPAMFKLKRSLKWKTQPPLDFTWKILKNRRFKEDKIRNILQSRDFEPIPQYAQLYINFETALRKLSLMQSFNDINDKRLIFLGDDDLMSPLCALTGDPERVTVLDLDERVIKLIKGLSKKYDLNIETLKHDLRKPLPNGLKGKFDVFCTDPSHCLGGILLFVSRGISALDERKENVGYFVIQTIDEPPIIDTEKRIELTRYLEQMRATFSCIIPFSVEYFIPPGAIQSLTKGVIKSLQSPNFVEYSKTIWNELQQIGFIDFSPHVCLRPESLVRIVTAKGAKPLITGSYDSEEEKKYGPIYYWEILSKTKGF